MITIGGQQINLLVVAIMGLAALFYIQFKLCNSRHEMKIKMIPTYIIGIGLLGCVLIALGVFDFSASGYDGNVNVLLAIYFAVTLLVMSLGIVAAWFMSKVKKTMDGIEVKPEDMPKRGRKFFENYGVAVGGNAAEEADDDDEYEYDEDEEYEYEEDDEEYEYDDDSEDEDYEEYIEEEEEVSEEDTDEEKAEK